MAEVELPNVEEIEEIKQKSFTKKVALVTAIFAVALAITSLGGNNATKEMVLASQQASDQWSFYQAKAIREHLYRNMKAQLEVALLTGMGTIKPEAQREVEAKIKKMTEEEERFGHEKADIEKQAKQFEEERDSNRAKDPYFDYAEVLLQVAIVMASIAIISGFRPIFFFALGSACLGALLSVNGFLMVFRIPFLH